MWVVLPQGSVIGPLLLFSLYILNDNHETFFFAEYITLIFADNNCECF